MDDDFFKYLPSEIVLNIFSRLPTRAAMACKCVCKPWLSLLATPEFVNPHMSRSVPGLAVETHSNSFEIIEFVDELGLDVEVEHRWDVAFNFSLPFDEPIHSSANGLIFLRGFDHGDLILCNPITRDYIKLPSPQQTTSEDQLVSENFGFGVSGTTGQYKVVRVFVEKPLHEEYENDPLPFEFQYECQVYTVGTGSWRKVPSGNPHLFCEDLWGVLLNGNLHWMVIDITTGHYLERISCFDLETERFSTLTVPPPCGIGSRDCKTPSVLRGCLCVSHITADGEIVIWLMKEYGDEKSWTKEVFVVDVLRGLSDELHVCPIRVFENGDILMGWAGGRTFYYSNKTKTLDYDVKFRGDHSSYISTTMYAASFVSLKNFGMENVRSF
ncbi:F-box protein CPR1-like isoform X1 [Salvia hispanica]|uniref:F-box protein CPR1-like isoform X1 n=1 Tax=Salvia hispanica TaxID=49212 RepID=UPI002009BC58|nr:F-box protein CPR1-like isoform X1 [Salvia hispanica]